MGRFANEHPVEVRKAVGDAIADGMKVPEAVRRLAQGTLAGYHGTYDLPTETARYYGKKERALRQATSISTLAKGDPSRAVDNLARQLLTEVEYGIIEARRSATRDPETLKKWGDTLKVVGSLVRPEEAPKQGRKKRKEPPDPLTAALTTAASEPVPHPPSRETGNEQGGGQSTTTHPDTEDNTASGGVAARASDRRLVACLVAGRVS